MIDLFVSVVFWWIPWIMGFAILAAISLFAGGFAWYLAENWVKQNFRRGKWQV